MFSTAGSRAFQTHRAPIAIWVLLSLTASFFHESWRDEAQAWLVASNASSLLELWLKSSMEATGPLYYLLLWPFAQLIPQAYPSAIFWISWTGTFLLLLRLWMGCAFIPRWVKWMVTFGMLLGYEYAVIARLYGWGGFFLLSGIDADTQNRKPMAALFLSLAAATQLNFLFAASGWMAFQILSRRKIEWTYWVVSAVILLELYHLSIARHLRPWETVPLAHVSGMRIGTTLGAIFAQTPGMWGWGGFAIFLLGFGILRTHGRLGLLVAAIPFSVLFLCVYSGIPRARHGGPVFLLWLCLACLNGGLSSKVRKRILGVLLSLSCMTYAIAQWNGITKKYSYGLAAARAIAEKIEERKGANRTPKLWAVDEVIALVPAARLGTDILYSGRILGCPYFKGPCGSWLSLGEQAEQGISIEPSCDGATQWFHLSRPGNPTPVSPGGKWVEIFLPDRKPTTDEFTVVRELVCPPQTQPAS